METLAQAPKKQTWIVSRNPDLDAAVEIVVERIPLDQNVEMSREPRADSVNRGGSFQASAAHECRTSDREVRFPFDLDTVAHLPAETEARHIREFGRLLKCRMITADGKQRNALAGTRRRKRILR